MVFDLFIENYSRKFKSIPLGKARDSSRSHAHTAFWNALLYRGYEGRGPKVAFDPLLTALNQLRQEGEGKPLLDGLAPPHCYISMLVVIKLKNVCHPRVTKMT
jgi:hypothetical protein